MSRDLVNRLARFGAAVLLARALTLEDYGVVNVGIAAAGIAFTATALGLNDLGAREVAARPADLDGRSRLAGQILTARIALLGGSTIIALLATALASPESLTTVLIVGAIALAMAGSAEWMLRGLERMAAFGNAMALGGIVVLIGSAVVLATSGSASAALAVILAGEIVATCGSWVWAGTVPIFRVDLAQIRLLLRRSWPLAISSLALYSFYTNLDTILLAAIRSAEEAGLYSAPYRVFLGLNAISIYMAYAYLPILTRGVEAGNHGPAFDALRRAVRYLLVYAAVLVTGAELVGGDLLGIVFGSEFSAMGDVFVVLCLGIMWFSVGYPVGYALIARDQNRHFLAGAGAGGILNLTLNLALIPAFGTIGAAAATAGAFAASCLIWLWGNRILGRETAGEIAAMTSISLATAAGLIEASLRGPAIALTVVIILLYASPLYPRRLRVPWR